MENGKVKSPQITMDPEELLDSLYDAIWIANCAMDADINGRKAAGCIRDGITSRVAQIRAAIAKIEEAMFRD